MRKLTLEADNLGKYYGLYNSPLQRMSQLLWKREQQRGFWALRHVSFSVAAGDSFAGYLGASLALGMPLPDAIRRAGAAGAITVTRRGASPSLPHRGEVDALLATMTTEGIS